MPRQHVGIDIIEIPRIERAISRWRDIFLTRIYTDAELESCRNATPSLAARFAAKEATIKAIGIKGLRWREIEIISNGNGAPSLQLHGRALKKSIEAGITEFSVTMSHSKENAIAMVIGDAV